MAANGPASRPVLVLDFGAQYVQLIARRVRERHAFARIVRHDITAERIRQIDPLALILSGGPSSVYEPGAPDCDPGIFKLGLPILGICYGMHLACKVLGAKVNASPAREFGRAAVPSLRSRRASISRCASRDQRLDEPRRPDSGRRWRFPTAGDD